MKCCLIGCRGHIGYVFEHLEQLPQLEIAAVSGGGEPAEVLLELCRQSGFNPPVYEDWRRMLDEVKPDLLVVAGPFELHAAMGIEALRRDIHVFCEKPAALTLAELAALEQAAAASRGVLISMVGLRYLPEFYLGHQLVAAGAVGRIRLLSARKSYKLGTRPEFYHRRESYGGTIPWVGAHAVDWILWFSGGSFLTVDAVQTPSGGDMELGAMCQFRLDTGAFAQCSIDYFRPEAAPTHGDDRLRVVGEQGVLEIAGGKIELLDGKGRQLLMPEPCGHTLFQDFIAFIEGRGPAPETSAGTMALTRALLLARLSADTGVTVRF